VLQRYRPEIIRFFILSSHYRSPLNYSDEHLNEAAAALTRLYTALRGIELVEATIEADYKTRFEQAMDDDFNTPVALSVLFDLARELNKVKENDREKAVQLAATLRYLGSLLGILQDAPETFLKGGAVVGSGDVILSDEQIEQQIQARLDAKKNKDWSTADRIRDELKEQGVILEDVPGGTNWRRE
jgi:cysteinyl-tRNA synthetase